jgi:hypothetical protein
MPARESDPTTPPDDDPEPSPQTGTRKAAAGRRQPRRAGGRTTVGRPEGGTSSTSTGVPGRPSVLSDEQRAAVRAAVLGLDPLTDDQVAAVCEVIVAIRSKPGRDVHRSR